MVSNDAWIVSRSPRGLKWVMAVFVEVFGAFGLTISWEQHGDHVYDDSACAGNADSRQRYGVTVPPDNLLQLFQEHRHRNPKPFGLDRPAGSCGVGELQDNTSGNCTTARRQA